MSSFRLRFREDTLSALATESSFELRRRSIPVYAHYFGILPFSTGQECTQLGMVFPGKVLSNSGYALDIRLDGLDFVDDATF